MVYYRVMSNFEERSASWRASPRMVCKIMRFSASMYQLFDVSQVAFCLLRSRRISTKPTPLRCEPSGFGASWRTSARCRARFSRRTWRTWCFVAGRAPPLRRRTWRTSTCNGGAGGRGPARNTGTRPYSTQDTAYISISISIYIYIHV